MRVAVLVPSYRRPKDLARCLEAIRLQTKPADQVILVIRTEDTDSLAVARLWQSCLPIDVVEVDAPGHVHAQNAGLARCNTEIVAITDDDAAPRPDWLARIDAHFTENPKAGGVGGRDWVQGDDQVTPIEKKTVGRVSWFGRIVGNHHLGIGPARDVDILKGANCSYRLAAIRPIGFDTRMRGAGSETYNDMAISLAVQRAGWRLLYDPAVAVDHFPAPRADGSRGQPMTPSRAFDDAYNHYLAISSISDNWRRTCARIWSAIIGTRTLPGLAWGLSLLLLRGYLAIGLWRAANAGRKAARKAPAIR